MATEQEKVHQLMDILDTSDEDVCVQLLKANHGDLNSVLFALDMIDEPEMPSQPPRPTFEQMRPPGERRGGPPDMFSLFNQFAGVGARGDDGAGLFGDEFDGGSRFDLGQVDGYPSRSGQHRRGAHDDREDDDVDGLEDFSFQARSQQRMAPSHRAHGDFSLQMQAPRQSFNSARSTFGFPLLHEAVAAPPTEPVVPEPLIPVFVRPQSMPNRNIEEDFVFTVHYRDDEFVIVLPSEATIGDLKAEVAKLTHIPIAEQHYFHKFLVMPNTHGLRAVGMKTEEEFTVEQLVSEDAEYAGDLDGDEYFISVYFTDSPIELNCVKTMRISELKEMLIQLSDLDSVEPSSVILDGWPGPRPPKDHMKLEDVLHARPAIELKMSLSFDNEQNSFISSEEDEDEDFPLPVPVAPPVSSKPKTEIRLINSLYDIDITAGTIQFNENFKRRFGSAGPDFYVGTLNEALVDNLVLIYLHNDANIETNVFCSHTLCAPDFKKLVDGRFVCWGWDIGTQVLKRRLKQSVDTAMASAIISSRCPIVMVATRTRTAGVRIFKVSYGHLTLDELASMMQSCFEEYQDVVGSEVAVEQSRLERELMKQQQDEAFQQSLESDRQKEAEMKFLEEKKRNAEEEEKARQEREERALREAKALEEAEAKAAQAKIEESKAQLGNEPNETEPYVGAIKFRMPGSVTMTRRFRESDTVKSLIMYVSSVGFPEDKFTIFLPHPKREVNQMPLDQSLLDASLLRQMLVVEANE